MRVLCLTDFPIKPPDRWIWNYLPDQPDDVDFLCAQAADRSAAWGKLLTRYPAYFRLARHALSQLACKPYDLVITWEAAVGIPFAIASQRRHGRVPPIVILAFDPGDVPRIFQPLIRLGMNSVAHCTVLTPSEAAIYATRFAFPASRITVSSLPSHDLSGAVQQSDTPHPFGGAPYIHASGRSSRDYATLIKAVAGLPVRAVIHGRDYNFQGLDIPPNVEIGDLAPLDEFQSLVHHALFEVVPLQPRLRSAGATAVVFAMMMGKPVVATRNRSLVDLVEEGVTGLLVEPGNVNAMRQAILHLLDHPSEVTRMGVAARQRFEQRHSFGQFARHTHQILQQVLEQSREQT